MKKEAEAPQKKLYNAPTLWVHGSIEDLTKANTTAGPRFDTRGKNSDFRTH